MWIWWRTIPGLRPHFRLIAFDNRGVGESDKPDEPYSMGMMAEDAAELLRALKVEQVDVLGISMGGYTGDTLSPQTRKFLEETHAATLGKPFNLEEIRRLLQRIQ